MDLISRQAAIDAIWSHATNILESSDYDVFLQDIYKMAHRHIAEVIERLPSAQPKIIYCGDCKYKDDGIDEDGIPFLKCLNGRSYGGTRINDFCSWAERRNDVTLN